MSIQPGMRAASLARITPIAWQTLFLFVIDLFTNGVDYGFHIYLGRMLAPSEFAIVQTINAALLIVITACAVLQPVVAKYVAAFRATEEGIEKIRGVFRLYMVQGTVIGIGMTWIVWLLQDPIAVWMNVPIPAIAISAFMLLLALVRPVVFGMLQGQQQFLPFGWTRAAFAIGRLALAVLFVGLWNGGAVGGITAMVLGTVLSLLVGVVWLGKGVWGRTLSLPRHLVWEGWQLSFWALVAYTAYMSLLNSDVIWVNRTFAPDMAGNYAAAVVFRRILAVLPGAILIILYPRLVALISNGELPDRLLGKTMLVIITPTVVLTALYYVYGVPLVELVLGGNYPLATPLLGGMGVAMMGYGVVGIWLNLFLATRPLPFVLLLALVAGIQSLLLAQGIATLNDVVLIFGVGGWVLAWGGLLLYWLWLRPILSNRRVL
jgi:O-antigen/teichoic acid export membrane protein